MSTFFIVMILVLVIAFVAMFLFAAESDDVSAAKRPLRSLVLLKNRVGAMLYARCYRALRNDKISRSCRRHGSHSL